MSYRYRYTLSWLYNLEYIETENLLLISNKPNEDNWKLLPSMYFPYLCMYLCKTFIA